MVWLFSFDRIIDPFRMYQVSVFSVWKCSEEKWFFLNSSILPQYLGSFIITISFPHILLMIVGFLIMGIMGLF